MKSNYVNFSAIILAAGIGKRMQSKKSKVLHNIAGKPMIQRTVEILEKLNPMKIIVVANPDNITELKTLLPYVTLAVQKQPLGTADATEKGLKLVSQSGKNIAVLYGDDTAFYKPQTIQKVFKVHLMSNAKITFVTIIKDNPQGLGRIIRKNGKLQAIVEEIDASSDQKKIKEVNDGLYFFKKDYLLENLSKLSPSKTTGELYITDTIELALKNKEKVETYTLENDEQWHGINTQAQLTKANLKLNKSIHIMGIGGAGAAAIAGISQSLGYNVSGCDINPDLQYIDKTKIKVLKDHNKNHLDDISCLVISPAILKFKPENQEILEANEKGIPTLTWQEFQGSILMENKYTIAVAGAFGKSTTCAMIGKMLTDIGLDPTVEVGAKVLGWGNNFRVGGSKYYVCEADEYNDNFLNYNPDIAVILNIAWDHPDYFKSQKEVTSTYRKFIENIKPGGSLIIGPDPKLIKLVKSIISVKKGLDSQSINVLRVKDFEEINLKIIGDFRKENVNAALTLANLLKLDINKAKKSISQFSGLTRRLEFKGEISGVRFYDDYAVQPYTIEKTANALRQIYPDANILLILEPHTFSRVNIFFNNFVRSLMNIKVDQIFITDIYAAREKWSQNSLSQKLANQIGKRAAYTGTIKNSSEYVRRNLGKHQIILTMGAGDVYKVYDYIKTYGYKNN